MVLSTWNKRIAVGALVAVALLIALGVSISALLESACGNEVLQEAVSPDRKYKALVFQRDCGATTGFSTQISVISALANLENAQGNLFSADDNHGAAPAGKGGGPEVKVEWRSTDELVVLHHASARVFRAERQLGAVKVKYQSLPSSSSSQ
jgi:hypothetical protein